MDMMREIHYNIILTEQVIGKGKLNFEGVPITKMFFKFQEIANPITSSPLFPFLKIEK